MMDSQLLKELRAELEAQRDDVVVELQSLGADPNSDQVRKLAGVDDNFADSASATAERADTFALIEHARERLADIDRALERMDMGTYGVCERCGHPIAAPRLEVRPMSVRCVDCASAP
jgi:DnaK suppressor protein